MARRGSDTSTVIGLLIGVGGLLVGFILDGGNIRPHRDPGVDHHRSGTVGALTISSSLGEVLRIPPLITQSMRGCRGRRPSLRSSSWSLPRKRAATGS